MGGSCAIKKCPSSKPQNSKGVKFLRIPSGKNDLKRRADWLLAAKKTEEEVHSNSKICEHHFRPEDWEKLRQDGTRKLRNNAVPSLNLHFNIKSPLVNITNSRVFNSSNDTACGSNSNTVNSVNSVHNNVDVSCASTSNSVNSCSQSLSAVSSLKRSRVSSISCSKEYSQFDHSYYSKSPVACSTPVRTPVSRQALSNNVSNVSDNSASPIPLKKNNLQFDMCDDSAVSANCSPVPALKKNILQVNLCDDSAVSVETSCVEPSLEPAQNLSKENSCPAVLELLQAEVRRLQKENEKLQTLASTVPKLNKTIGSLREALVKHRKAKYQMENKLKLTEENVSKVVTPDMLKAMGRKSTRGMKRSSAAVGEGLYYKAQCGGTSYGDIAKRFYWPARRTLSHRTQHVKFRAGILMEMIKQLEAVVPTLHDKERDASICFDEMAIDPNKNINDPSTKSGIGQCTLPGHLNGAKKAFVAMLCGISSRWKMVVAYHFGGNRNPAINTTDCAKGLLNFLYDILRKVEGIGIRVSSFSSDMGSENRAMWKVLGICAKRNEIISSIPHPCDDKRRLHIVPDVPHVFKNIVSMLQRNKYIVLSPDVVKTYELTTNIVAWEHIEYLMEYEVKHELKIAFRLTVESMKSGHFEKMQVGRARAIFNNRTVAGLILMGDQLNRPEFKTTAWFIAIVVRWFDLMTSRSNSIALSLANEKAHREAIAHLRMTSIVFQTMKVKGGNRLKPSQQGLLIATSAIIDLQKYFLYERGYKFILTSRFSQDCLENLFSQIRRRNSTPNALLFKNVLKSICISGKTCRPPRGHGYEYDDGEFLTNILLEWKDESYICPTAGAPGSALSKVHCPQITDNDIYSIVDDWEMLPLYDMAGVALHKAIKTHKIKRDCPCVQSLTWEGPGYHPYAAAVLEKNYKDGALVEVSNECFLAIVKCELTFRILRDAVLKEPGVDVVQEVCNRSLYAWEDIKCPPCHEDLPMKVLKRYVKMRFGLYKLKGKKDMAEAAAVFSSKSVAQNKFVQNLGAKKSS